MSTTKAGSSFALAHITDSEGLAIGHAAGHRSTGGVGVPIAEVRNWKEDARCQGLAEETYGEVNDESWYDTNPETHRVLERICARCPVMEQCYEEALSSGEAWAFRAGVWFGPQRNADISVDPDSWGVRRSNSKREAHRRALRHHQEAA